MTVSKEYTASPKRFDKDFAARKAKVSKQNSKKNSVVSNDGYFSDGGGRINSNSKKLAGKVVFSV